nr:unnamed protein product [Naegleria fowleri]
MLRLSLKRFQMSSIILMVVVIMMAVAAALSTLITNVHADMSSPIISPNEYPSSVRTPQFKLYWKFHTQTPNLLQSTDMIEFAIQAHTRGWLALGLDFQDGIGMKQADCFIGFFDEETSQPMIYDFWLPGKSIPKNDTLFGGVDNILQRTGSLSSQGVTTLKFTRHIDTGDVHSDHVVKNKTIAISWAFNVHTRDITQKHTYHGDFEVNLVTHVGELNLYPEPILQFHLIATGGVALVMICFGLSYSIFSMKEKNFFIDFVFHKRLFKLIRNRFLGSLFNSILDLTLGEVFLVMCHLCLVATWFLFGFFNSTSSQVAKGLAYALIFSLSTTLLPMTRYSIFIHVFGISFERAVKFHKWVARMSFLLATSHGIMMVIARANDNNLLDLVSVESPDFVLFGPIAWFSLLFLMIFSLQTVRRKLWELFKAVHYLFVPTLLVMISLHGKGWSRTLPVLSISLFLLLVDHTLRLVLGYFVPTRVSRLDYNEETQITTCVFEKPQFAFWSLDRESLGMGKFVYVYLPRVSPFQSHPFTISSYTKLDSSVEFTCHVKNLGHGWTQSLAKVAQEKDHSSTELMVRVEGPYGKLSVHLPSYSTVILVAGGIGITPIHAIYSELMAHKGSNQNIYLVWTMQNNALLQLFPALLNQKENVKQRFYFTRQEQFNAAAVNGHSDARMHFGERPNFTKILENSVMSSVDSLSDKYAAVVVCGPHEMIVDVNNGARNASKSTGVKFHIHKEVFEL